MGIGPGSRPSRQLTSPLPWSLDQRTLCHFRLLPIIGHAPPGPASSPARPQRAQTHRPGPAAPHRPAPTSGPPWRDCGLFPPLSGPSRTRSLL